MASRLLYHHKSKVLKKFVAELKLWEVTPTAKYPDGVRYSLICIDTKSGQRVLFDNHHPKGHHIHLDDEEMPYNYTNEDKLFEDFKLLVFDHLGVKL